MLGGEAVSGLDRDRLADEPTGNIGTSSGGDVMGLLTELWHQGRTLIVVTHDRELARRADRVVELCDGVITSDSARQEESSQAEAQAAS